MDAEKNLKQGRDEEKNLKQVARWSDEVGRAVTSEKNQIKSDKITYGVPQIKWDITGYFARVVGTTTLFWLAFIAIVLGSKSLIAQTEIDAIPTNAVSVGSQKTNIAPERFWRVTLGQRIEGSAAVADDGTVYVTVSGNVNFADVSGGKLVALKAMGSELWDFRIRTDIHSSPALGDDGTIYFGARDGLLYAFNPAGKLKWTFKTGGWVDSSAAIGTNGTIYFGSWDKKFYAVNPNGTKKWELVTGGVIDSSPALGRDGTIYFGSHDKKFYAVNPDGSLKWSYPTRGAIVASPAIGSDDSVCFSSTDGRLYLLNADGTKRWDLWTGGVETASPVLGADGAIYITASNLFYAFNADGTKRWEFGHPVVKGAAMITQDATIYFAGLNEGAGVLFGFDFIGQYKSYTWLEQETACSPSVAADGTIYIGASQMFAYHGQGGLAKTSWPKFRGNARQNGRPNTP